MFAQIVLDMAALIAVLSVVYFIARTVRIAMGADEEFKRKPSGFAKDAVARTSVSWPSSKLEGDPEYQKLSDTGKTLYRIGVRNRWT